MTSGTVLNIQHYSLHDGPGIRTTVFLQGCPLDCWWCHNPESQSATPRVMVVESRCMRCGECWRVCHQRQAPTLAHNQSAESTATSSPSSSGSSHDSDACRLCGECIKACPTGAREIVGKRTTADDVFAEILKDRIFYDQSSGGVTFSGGEPLMQPEFLRELLQKCHRRGIHTAVDTCGFVAWKELESIASLTDLFLYDLKAWDEIKHVQYTGVSNRAILENLERLNKIHRNIWIRVPVIPNVNDHPADMEAIARFASTLENVKQVNLLPYHGTGIHKFRREGRFYRLSNTPTPSRENMELIAAHFLTRGLTTKTGG